VAQVQGLDAEDMLQMLGMHRVSPDRRPAGSEAQNHINAADACAFSPDQTHNLKDTPE
jgi:hypothetical protein